MGRGRINTSRIIIRLREARKALNSIEALGDRIRTEIKREDAVSRVMTNRNDSKIPKEVERNQHKEDRNGKRISYMRRWLIEKLSMECDESEELATDVSERLMQKVPEFKAQLYFLLSRLLSMIPGSKEDVTCYDEFKSSLEWLVKDSENKIVRAILDLLNAVEKQVGKLGRSVQKVEKRGRVDELLDQLLCNIQLVACLEDQSGCAEPDISSLGDHIQECEAKQKEIESKMKVLKVKD
ncbi:hypothetical protein CDL15_Pgr001148 [Punica granatum]|uniref:Uncharacterized protein n=1 Tax=Punica granatum TaxID=22663 RepID=A0A218WJM5_PUNGR|nr:hypothetical protein CDL15_Pgr001148 [Punica granatum]PKI69099.1 hypothetical protein CRG98_010568 [Punica granatum]